MTNFSHEQAAVAKAGRNRAQLRRQFGLSFQAVEVVLKLANMRAFGNPRTSQADVARVLGINRSRVCQHLKKAETVGLLLRVGRTYFFRFAAVLSACEQAAIARKAAAMKRAFAHKCREVKEKLGFVAHRATHTTKVSLESGFESAREHQAALQALYIPPHLRKSAL